MIMALTTHVVQSGENYLYVFKGARSAPNPGWPPILASAARGCADPDAAQPPPVTGRAFRVTVRAWAPLAALRPSGPRRRRRASRPRSPPHRLGAATVSAKRASCKSGPSSRRSSVKPGKIPVKSASCARVLRMTLRATLDCDLPRHSVGAYRKDGYEWEPSCGRR